MKRRAFRLGRLRSALMAWGMILAVAETALPTAAEYAAPAPDEIYLRARDRQQQYITQPYLLYTAHERVDNSDGFHSVTLQMVLRNTDQHALILHGNSAPTPSMPAITPETYVNQAAPTLGPSPYAGFDIGTEPNDPGEHPDDNSTVRHSRFYRAKLAAIERLDGHQVFHLILQPRSMPERFTTRDLWIDTGNDETLKAVVQAHAIFNSHRVPIYATLHFTEYGRGWLLTRIQSMWNFASTGRVSVDYRYSNFRFANQRRGVRNRSGGRAAVKPGTPAVSRCRRIR